MTDETSSSVTLWRARESDWRALVEKALGGKGVDSLITHSDDGLPIGPIYGFDHHGTLVRRTDTQEPWTVVQRIDDPDADQARELLGADLAGGATGIELVFDGSASAARTGFGLDGPDSALLAMLSDGRDLQVRLDAGAATYDHYQNLEPVAEGELVLCFDPLADGAAQGGFERPLAEIEGALVKAARDFLDAGLNGCSGVADGRIWAAAGASEAQEIAAVLGSTVHSVRVLIDGGLTPGQALAAIGLIADAGAGQLLTIAKLRALRLCHARIVEAFGATPVHARLHAETSWRMMTRYDVHTNILRTTSAAFAAGIGGADSITVLPCTIAAGTPDAFARRVARNIQTIIVEEAGLARVSDPGSGAGAVETLTEAIAESSWTEFRKLEAAGGLAAALRSGVFQRSIAKIRESRSEKIARRRSVITGISKFSAIEPAEPAAIAARLKTPIPPPTSAETFLQVPAARFAEPFEALRDRAAKLTAAGKPPKVFLANLGDPADFAEAAQFAASLFAAGGVAVVDGGGFDGPGQAAQAFSASGAGAACISGRDDTLQRHAATTARALKDSGATRAYVVGAAEPSDSIDAALNIDTDVVEILSDLLALSD